MNKMKPVEPIFKTSSLRGKLGTQAPSAVVYAEGDVIAELEELEATHTLCVICSGPLAERKGFFALFPVIAPMS